MPREKTRSLVRDPSVRRTKPEPRNEEPRRLKDDLETSRDHFARLYDLSPVGCLTLDADGVVREANLTAASLLGLARAELLKRKLSRFVTATSRDDLLSHVRRVLATRARQTCEIQLRRAEGASFTGHLESIAVREKPGGTARCLVALIDVTRQREAKVAVRESQEQLAGIIRSAMDAIVTVDSRQRVVLCNRAAEQMFGWEAGKLMGRPLSALIPERCFHTQAPPIRGPGKSCVTDRRAGGLGQIRGRRSDGTEFPIEASMSQVEAEGKTLFTIVLRDVTERLRMEADQKKIAEALRRSEAALHDFFAESPLGLLWVSAEGRIVRVNRAQLEIFGCTAGEVFQHSIAEFFAEPELAADALDRLARKETLRNHRVRLTRKDGPMRHVLIDANGLWEADRLIHSRWFVRDISRRVELEREILKISELEQQRLGQELHDGLCQQLSCIEFLAYSLEQDLVATSKAASRRAAEIAKLVRETNARTRELSHGLAPAHLEAEGLVGALEALATRTRKVFRSDCRFHCASPVDVGDPETRQHLYRIAQEAVNNAIKHGRARRIEINLAANDDRLILGVRDNGVGLPKKPRGASGMGLRIMQYRAGLICGSLAVQRQPGGGTAVVCSVHVAGASSGEGRKR